MCVAAADALRRSSGGFTVVPWEKRAQHGAGRAQVQLVCSRSAVSSRRAGGREGTAVEPETDMVTTQCVVVSVRVVMCVFLLSNTRSFRW